MASTDIYQEFAQVAQEAEEAGGAKSFQMERLRRAVGAGRLAPGPCSQTAGEVTSGSAVATVFGQLPKGSAVNAAELVMLTNTQFPSGH
ncbi:MAG: hypothetical protein ACRDWV_02235, partial [Acidimicrobiales bacterium]